MKYSLVMTGKVYEDDIKIRNKRVLLELLDGTSKLSTTPMDKYYTEEDIIDSYKLSILLMNPYLFSI